VTNPNQMREIGFFDTFLAPASDGPGTDGAWGVYPFLPSGNVLISDITNGLFVLRDITGALGSSVGRVGFIGLSASVSESAGSATVRLQRTGGSSGSVTVQYATADGTATAASDYTAASGTLTWQDGDMAEKSFTVSITNDTLEESNETFRVTLSNPAGGATVDGSTELEVTIANDDGASPPPSGGAGGGGGATDLLTLLAALAALGLRRSVPRRAGQGTMDSPRQL
jgi:hypothetical protein